jgi:hypothetical protein
MIKGRQPAYYCKRESKLHNAFIKGREKSGRKNQDQRKQTYPLIPTQDTGFKLQNRTEKEAYCG